MESRHITFNGVELFSLSGAVDHPIAQDVEGIGGPSWSAPSGDRAGADGSWSGTPRRKARPVSVSGVTVSADALASEAWMDRIIAAGIGKNLPLTFEYASGPRTMLTRVDGAVKLRRKLANTCEWQLPLLADDPAWYLGDGVNPAWTGTTSRAVEVGGISFPLGPFPIAWGAGVVSGSLAYTNPGTTGKVELRLDGPLTDPTITTTNADGVRTLGWSLEIPAGAFLSIDPVARQALLNGQSSRPPAFRGWPRLAKGQNSWQFHAGGASTGALTVYAYPAY